MSLIVSGNGAFRFGIGGYVEWPEDDGDLACYLVPKSC
jgi:hypothetical protein